MALPKHPKPLAERNNRSRIEEAMRIAGTMQTPGVSPEEGAARRSPQPTLSETAPSPAPSAPPATAARRPASAPVLPPHLPPAPEKRLGRPPLLDNRTERISASVKPSTRDRLRLAMYGENIRTKGKSDQSLIIEEALLEWLDFHGYHLPSEE